MGTIRRRKHAGREGRITQKAIDAFRAGDRETLRRELHLPPWQVSPLEAVSDCPWPASTAGGRTWQASCELRAALLNEIA